MPRKPGLTLPLLTAAELEVGTTIAKIELQFQLPKVPTRTFLLFGSVGWYITALHPSSQ